MAKVRERIEKLRQEIESTQSLHDSVRDKLRVTEREISKHHRALKKLQRKLRAQNNKLATLHTQRKKLNTELNTHYDLLAKQIRAAYMIGRQEYVKLLLNQEDPAAVGRTITYYDYFNKARAERIDAANQTLAELKKVEASINVETAQLKQLQDKRQQKKKELQKTSKAHALVVAQLREELLSKEQSLQRLVEDEKRLSQLVKALDKAIPDILTAPGKRKAFARLRGALKWPAQGRVQALFGKPRRAGKLKWNGVLIEAKQGRDVKAISHGRIAYAEWLRGYGLLVIIDHGQGYMSLYGHNQAIFKETGEWVEAGEVIASVGRSGGRSSEALYFEIRHNGKPINPKQWCRG